MTAAAALADGDLGPATERLFAAAFAASAVITRKDAAALLGYDVKTLDSLTDAGTIRAVRRGTLRAYIERDLRAFLLEGSAECPSSKTPIRETGSTTLSSKVVAFTARPARLRVVTPRPSSASAGSRPPPGRSERSPK